MQTKRTFFVTSTCHDRAAVFRNPRPAELFIETIYGYRAEKRFLMHAFVLMPDHVHLVITPAENLTLERAIQFSHRLGGRREIWQRSFEQHRIRNLDDYRHHVDYTHNNPVPAGLAADAREYPYSSANNRFEVDSTPEEFRGLKP